MECAFIAPEMLKTAAFADEFAHAVSGDDLFVDELLDFSNDFQDQQLDQPEENEPDRKTASSVLQENLTPPPPENSANDEFGSLAESELSIPVSKSFNFSFSFPFNFRKGNVS